MAESTNNPRLAVIGGSGFYQLFDETAPARRIDTPYGATSGPITTGLLAGRPVAFLPRHGEGHAVPPHRVNYRANLWALKSLGVAGIIGFSAVGGLRPEYRPGQFVVTDQLIDRTHGRSDTFFDGDHGGVQHVSAAQPFCAALRTAVVDALSKVDEDFHSTGTVVVIQGPRFSTVAESRWFRSLGADTINMTQYPEAVLATELNMGVANLSFITDSDTGDEYTEPVEGAMVLRRLAAALPRARAAIVGAIELIEDNYRPRTGIPVEAVNAIMRQG